MHTSQILRKPAARVCISKSLRESMAVRGWWWFSRCENQRRVKRRNAMAGWARWIAARRALLRGRSFHSAKTATATGADIRQLVRVPKSHVDD